MGEYKIALSDQAVQHLKDWKRSGQIKALRKIERIIEELSQRPFSGIGSPEPLKYNLAEYWSRQIDKKNRLIYQIKEDVVFILTCRGHYEDK